MPRAQIKTAVPIVVAQPIRFTPETQEDVIDLLGYDLCSPEEMKRVDKAIACTAQAAANYFGAVELIPNLPEPAHMHAEIKAFRKKGDFSDKAWRELHLWTQQTLSRYGDSGSTPPSNAEAIISACERYLQSNPVKPTGRPRHEARSRLIKELCRIFHGYGSPDGINDAFSDEDEPRLTERRQQGFVSPYSQLQQDRYDYVCTVFTEIGIPSYKDLHEDIVIQANTPGEHARRLSIILSRSRRRRRKLKQLT